MTATVGTWRRVAPFGGDVMALGNELFRFFEELEQHNDREWFQGNKLRYQQQVEAPMLALLTELEPALAKVAPRIRVDTKRSGGSLMRVQRDTRFSKHKTPYKTHVAAMLLHEDQHKRGAGMLGYLLHVGPDACWLGAGLSAPPAAELQRVREAIASGGERWAAVAQAVEGESLKRVPAGFPADHPFEADLRRKSFFRTLPFSRKQVTGKAFSADVLKAARELEPFLAFLAKPAGLRW